MSFHFTGRLSSVVIISFDKTKEVKVSMTNNWLRDRAQRNERIVPAQEKFIEDFTNYVKHRAREVAAHFNRTEDTEKLAPPNYFVTGMPDTALGTCRPGSEDAQKKDAPAAMTPSTGLT